MASSSSSADAAAEPGLVEEEEAPKQTIIFSLNVFETLDTAQSSHGIPSQDYAQYHHYCRKRLDRLRHHREVRSTLTHSSRYVEGHGSSGGGHGKHRRHAYCARELSPAIVEHEYVLWNLFVQAERAWAQARAAQKEENSSASGAVGKKKNKTNAASSRKHNNVRKRLNKAVKWATQFAELCEKCADEQTVQQAQAYLSWMKANAALECKKYADAYRRYQESRRILLNLAHDITTKNSSDETAAANQLAVSDLWTRWAETILKPLVRYCLHEARDEIDASEMMEVEAGGGLGSPPKKSPRASKNDNSISLEFRNQEIALDAYPQLAVLYLKMEDHLSPSDSGEEKGQLSEDEFLQLLSDLDDALSWSVAEASRYASLASGPAVQAKRAELATLQSFFQYHKLQLQRQRQEERVATLTDAAEIVHVYDALQQNAKAMADLPSSSKTDEDGKQSEEYLNHEDDPYWLEAQAHLVRIRAFRCYHLARLYESGAGGSSGGTASTTAQVSALLQQASMLQQRATEEVAACEMDDAYLDALDELKDDIQTMTCRVEATCFLESGSSAGVSGSSKTTDRPLWLRLDDLDAGTGVLADQPPISIPIPYKPVFYDLAWDYVDQSDAGLKTLQEYIDANTEQKEEEGSSSGGGGLFGWFSSK